jgi:hypothetical protein
MKRNSYSTYLFLGIMMFCGLSFVEVDAQKAVTGQAVRYVNNRRDIYHPRNENKRKELILDAVKDAIERGASINVGHVEIRNFNSTLEKSFEDVFDDFVSQNLQHYNVKWNRTSNYNFTLIEPKTWKCEVNGEVSNVDLGNIEPILPRKIQSIYITRKSYNVVYLNSGTEDGVEAGDKFVVYRHKQKKAVTGYHTVPKQVGLITIKTPHKRFSEGRIIKGIYNVRESQLVKKADFRTSRFGLEYQLSGNNEQINSIGLIENNSTLNILSHSIFLSHYSYKSRTGFKFGLEVLDTEISRNEINESVYLFVPKFNWFFSIGLIPDILILSPGFSIGYMLSDKNEISDYLSLSKKNWGADIVVETGIGAHVRIKFVDLIGGINYKYANDYQELKGFYPFAGVKFNFVNYKSKKITDE